MWDVQGEPVAPERFDPLQPSEVLDQYDGPRIFALTDRQDECCLAFWCDGDHECDRYLIVPFSPSLRQGLTEGRISVAEALDQPRLSVVDVDRTGRPFRSWRSEFSRLPREILPEPGTMLWPSLEPLRNAHIAGPWTSGGDHSQ